MIWILTNNLTDGSKLQILLRNARQILNIVTATFSASLFEGNDISVDCSTLSNDSEKLGCEWRLISQQLTDLKPDSEEDAERLMTALAKVNVNSQLSVIVADIGLVVKRCSRDHEQYGK
jgi:hypothetical protein